MSLARQFEQVVSGQRRGLRAALARGALRILEAPYTQIVNLRNCYYDRFGHAVQRVGVPVICVGNLTMGGTGKTPVVAWLTEQLAESGRKPAIVSRGYGRPTEGSSKNDEAEELAWRLPHIDHVQNVDRVLGAQQAIDKFGAEVIVLDDGFQHRRLHRDLNIVLIDATQPFGFGHVFPRGTLREPLAGLGRAGIVLITRSDKVAASVIDTIRETVRQPCPDVECFVATHAPAHLAHFQTKEPIDHLARKSVAAFCGIGRPDAFRQTLIDCKYDLVGFREFPDHYRYQASDCESIATWADELNAEAIVCTQKDFVKLEQDCFGPQPVWSLKIDIDVADGDRLMESVLRHVSRPEGV